MATELHAAYRTGRGNTRPSRCAHRSRKIILTLAGLWLLLYASFGLLFSPPLLDDADSVHAEVAREMVARQDWVRLYANGIRYLEKAPLMYWSMAASFTLFGPDWAARLPLAIATLALFLVVYATGHQVVGLRYRRFLCSADTADLPRHFHLHAHHHSRCHRLPLAFARHAVVLDLLEQPQPSRATAWGFAAACALNVLTKGLIGIVFPLAIVIIFLLLNRNLGHLRRWHPFSSLLVFLLIALPWHLAAGIANHCAGKPRRHHAGAGKRAWVLLVLFL